MDVLNRNIDYLDFLIYVWLVECMVNKCIGEG